MWILWMTSSLSSHSTCASVSERSRLVTHTAVSSPKCNSEKRPLSNSVAFQTLFKWHRYCGILKIHIVRKINTGIRYEPVYRPALVESILTGCITAWFGNSTAGNRRALQRVVRTARHIVGGELPSLQDIYTRRCTRKARRIIKDSSHPSHRLLSLLPSGRRFRSIRSRTSRLRDSFFPQANEQSQITHLHHTPTHTTCHALHFNTVQLDYTHTLH